jgi:hypothetical protein
VYCLYPYDMANVKQSLSDEEELRLIERLVSHKARSTIATAMIYRPIVSASGSDSQCVLCCVG